jgi:GAF domain-containing protein
MKRTHAVRSEKVPLPVAWAKGRSFKIPIPRDEKQRLKALHRYHILDTPPEENFDSITLLAAHICDAPVALLVLIDEDRQWFKSKVGVSLDETPRELSFCAHTIMKREIVMVPDARLDKRFARNPFVAAGPRYRFYAGAPLVTPDNRALGTLCVIDAVLRTLSASQQADLQALSRLAMTEMELRRSLLREGAVKRERACPLNGDGRRRRR